MKAKIFAFLIVLLVLLTPCLAFETRTGEVVTINEVIDDDLFASGSTITISGNINGDVIVIGSVVTVSGDVSGDLMVVGGTITVSGSVGDDLLVVGGQMIVNSDVSDDLLMAGGMASVGMDSTINGDVKIAGGMASIDGTINGDVVAQVDQLELGSSASIGGMLNHTSEGAIIPDISMISGGVQQIIDEVEEIEKPTMSEIIISSSWGFFWDSLVSIVTGLIIWYFFRNYVASYDKTISKKYMNNLGYGLLAAIVFPVISIILMITGVGLPLGFIGIVLYGISLYVAGLLLAFHAGRKVLEWLKISVKKNKEVWSLVTGVIVLKLVNFVPVVGWIIGLVLWFISYGALIQLEKTNYQECKKRKIC